MIKKLCPLQEEIRQGKNNSQPPVHNIKTINSNLPTKFHFHLKRLNGSRCFLDCKTWGIGRVGFGLIDQLILSLGDKLAVKQQKHSCSSFR